MPWMLQYCVNCPVDCDYCLVSRLKKLRSVLLEFKTKLDNTESWNRDLAWDLSRASEVLEFLQFQGRCCFFFLPSQPPPNLIFEMHTAVLIGFCLCIIIFLRHFDVDFQNSIFEGSNNTFFEYTINKVAFSFVDKLFERVETTRQMKQKHKLEL